jgi:hypothetical protein
VTLAETGCRGFITPFLIVRRWLELFAKSTAGNHNQQAAAVHGDQIDMDADFALLCSSNDRTNILVGAIILS